MMMIIVNDWHDHDCAAAAFKSSVSLGPPSQPGCPGGAIMINLKFKQLQVAKLKLKLEQGQIQVSSPLETQLELSLNLDS